MVGSEARFDIESTTPIAPEKIAVIADKRIVFLSEFRMGIKLDRKGWKKDIQVLIDYLKKIADTIENE
jgi:hypothetical protein